VKQIKYRLRKRGLAGLWYRQRFSVFSPPINPARCSLWLTGDVCLTNTLISKYKRNRSPSNEAWLIFRSPLLFKWQALTTNRRFIIPFPTSNHETTWVYSNDSRKCMHKICNPVQQPRMTISRYHWSATTTKWGTLMWCLSTWDDKTEVKIVIRIDYRKKFDYNTHTCIIRTRFTQPVQI